jgi:hypothetical protein
MYGIKTLSNLRCLKQLDQILLFIRRAGMATSHLCLCETVHTHHLSRPFCLTTFRFILLPFSMFYLFFQNNTITLHLWAVCISGDEQEKKFRKRNWPLFCTVRTSGLALCQVFFFLVRQSQPGGSDRTKQWPIPFSELLFLFHSSHNAFVTSARRLLFVHFHCLIFLCLITVRIFY